MIKWLYNYRTPLYFPITLKIFYFLNEASAFKTQILHVFAQNPLPAIPSVVTSYDWKY